MHLHACKIACKEVLNVFAIHEHKAFALHLTGTAYVCVNAYTSLTKSSTVHVHVHVPLIPGGIPGGPRMPGGGIPGGGPPRPIIGGIPGGGIPGGGRLKGACPGAEGRKGGVGNEQQYS